MTTASPRIGVIADTTLQGHLLSNAVSGQGYDLVVNTSPNLLEERWFNSEDIDLWVVDLTDEDRWNDFLDRFLEESVAPMLFCDGQAPHKTSEEYPRWERRLLTKMLDYVDRPTVNVQLEALAPTPRQKINIPTPSEFKLAPRSGRPQRVWVLGASLGGPEAVKVFLDSLPPELPVAFLLAQHIDASFIDTLAGVLCRDNEFSCSVGFDGDSLSHGKVTIAPIDYEVAFSETGVLTSTGKDWDGPYAPSIDQAISNVAQRYGQYSGAILFSGMGNDGSIAAPQMRQRGGVVWAQSADTCACSSQPDSVRETGCVSYSASPEQLALALVEEVRRSLSGQPARL
jgi:chemosensory pili system protein ChpB (putative protein-glutamate methylesterase)